jgi:hypothetical protein
MMQVTWFVRLMLILSQGKIFENTLEVGGPTLKKGGKVQLCVTVRDGCHVRAGITLIAQSNVDGEPI